MSYSNSNSPNENTINNTNYNVNKEKREKNIDKKSSIIDYIKIIPNKFIDFIKWVINKVINKFYKYENKKEIKLDRVNQDIYMNMIKRAENFNLEEVISRYKNTEGYSNILNIYVERVISKEHPITRFYISKKFYDMSIKRKLINQGFTEEMIHDLVSKCSNMSDEMDNEIYEKSKDPNISKEDFENILTSLWDKQKESDILNKII